MSEPSNDGEMTLEPCPFCGAAAQDPENTARTPKHPRWEIACSQFCASMYRGTKKEVVRAWNTRASLKQPRTQQPRITREQLCSAFLKPVFLDMGYKGEPNESDISRMAFRLRELGIEVVTDPPEVHE